MRAGFHTQPTPEILARVPEYGYTPDTETGSDEGDGGQLNRRLLASLSEPVLPAGFRFRAAAEAGPAAATDAHIGARHASPFSEPGMAGAQTAWP